MWVRWCQAAGVQPRAELDAALAVRVVDAWVLGDMDEQREGQQAGVNPHPKSLTCNCFSPLWRPRSVRLPFPCGPAA